MSKLVGIDLGTTNSLVGAVVDGEMRLFADEDGRTLLPSVVALGERGRLLVGRRAVNRRLLAPERAVQQVKRRMGEDTEVALGDENMNPPAVSALILGALLDRAEAALGARPSRAIITVPAYFDDTQRNATREAGVLAGLEVERLVNEPTAAALTHTTGEEATVLVYDFGGGTFDVSVLERDEGFLEVRASHGDTHLGGSDIDRALVEHVLGELGGDAERVRRDPAGLARLEAALERAKIQLSRVDRVGIHEPYLVGSGDDAYHLELELDRATLEAVAAPFVERTLTSVDEALAAAGLSGQEVDRVLLVGGCAHMPLVQARVAEHLDRPVLLADDPDEAVARGATLLAARAGGDEIDEVLVDVTPHTLSVGSVDRDSDDFRLVAVPVIPRNTVVPVERTQTAYTMTDDQPRVEAPVVQGEASWADENTQLGCVEVGDLPPSPAGSPVEITYHLDISGILHVTATHVPSGRSGEVTITRSPSRLSRQERRRAAEAVAALRQTPAAPAADEALDPAERRVAEALLARAERVLEKDAEMPEEARATIVEARGALAAALETGRSADEVAERSDDLSGALLDLL